MAMASQNSTYYPDPNMGMAMQMSASRYTPTGARDAMDRYFRAYWNTQSERAKAIEDRQMRAKMETDERTWKTGEKEKDRAAKERARLSEQDFKARESQLERESRSRINDMKWDEQQAQSEREGKFAWVEALTRLGGVAATYDQLYNEGQMRKSIFNIASGSLKKQFANEAAVRNLADETVVPYWARNTESWRDAGAGVIPMQPY